MKTIYSHGKDFFSCFSCDKTLTLEEPGERIMYVNGDKRIVEHVCKDCFDSSEYQDAIKILSSKYGMDIRSFPQMQD
jgi:hypothetical protein